MDGGFRRFVGDGDLDHGNKGDPTNRDEQHGGTQEALRHRGGSGELICSWHR